MECVRYTRCRNISPVQSNRYEMQQGSVFLSYSAVNGLSLCCFDCSFFRCASAFTKADASNDRLEMFTTIVLLTSTTT